MQDGQLVLQRRFLHLVTFGQFLAGNRFAEGKTTKLSSAWAGRHEEVLKGPFLRTVVVILVVRLLRNDDTKSMRLGEDHHWPSSAGAHTNIGYSSFQRFRTTSQYNFIWNTTDTVLWDTYARGRYRDVILPMTVIRRLDAVLERTKMTGIHRKEGRLFDVNYFCWPVASPKALPYESGCLKKCRRKFGLQPHGRRHFPHGEVGIRGHNQGPTTSIPPRRAKEGFPTPPLGFWP